MGAAGDWEADACGGCGWVVCWQSDARGVGAYAGGISWKACGCRRGRGDVGGVWHTARLRCGCVWGDRAVAALGVGFEGGVLAEGRAVARPVPGCCLAAAVKPFVVEQAASGRWRW